MSQALRMGSWWRVPSRELPLVSCWDPWVSWDSLVLTQDEGCQGGHCSAQGSLRWPTGFMDEEAEGR